MRRIIEGISSLEIPSDITVQVGGTTFALYKLPLVSKCGYIRKLLVSAEDSGSDINKLIDLSGINKLIDLSGIPGGADAFELAAKFCYGIQLDITADNVAMLRCSADFLEMTEDYAVGNLVSITELYIEEVALMSPSAAITMLHGSEGLLPVSEKIKLVSRCVDATAYMVCNDDQANMSFSSTSLSQSVLNCWTEELTVLGIETFQRVVIAMKARGLNEFALVPALMLYVQKSLRGLEIYGQLRKKLEPKQEYEKRVVLETVVSLLPTGRNLMSVSFLSTLLRAAIYLETTVACRLDLEKRMSLQLGQAVLEDLLIPSFSFGTGGTILDIDTVKRIWVNYLEHEVDGSYVSNNTDDDLVSLPSSDIEQVGKLMDSYLAETASDPNLTISRFISLSELVPEQARAKDDGMYRAIDIYLKAHPSLNEMEKKKICSLMNWQKLSRQACAHAAQNSRLPVQIVVQLLHHEQQRLRDGSNGGVDGGASPVISHKSSVCKNTDQDASEKMLLCLQKENEQLKQQLDRMQMHTKEIDNPSDNPQLPTNSFIKFLSGKLGGFNPFARPDTAKPVPAKGKKKPPRDRRHSIS